MQASFHQWRKYRGLSQGGHLAEMRPLDITQKTLEMMNSDVDDYTKTLHHRKIVRKTEETTY